MLKIFWKQHGGHIHMRVFYNGKAGDLVVTEKEFPAFRLLIDAHWTEEE